MEANESIKVSLIGVFIVILLCDILLALRGVHGGMIFGFTFIMMSTGIHNSLPPDH